MKFGRKKSNDAFDGAGRDADEQMPAGDDAELEDAAGAIAGPYDVADIDEDELAEGGSIDLGSVVFRPHAETEIRLQVDEESGEVLAAMLVAEDGMLEVRAFAAVRGGDLWSEARKEIASDTAQRGGTATEQDGPFGTELYCQVPVELEDGSAGVQPSRVIGYNGPRWFLRAVLLGRPAIEPDQAADWEQTIGRIVVRRGADPLPPGQPLALVLPPDAQQME